MISKEQTSYIALLARIGLTEKDTEMYQEQLSDILKYIDILNKVNTDNVQPWNGTIDQENAFREDVVIETEQEVKDKIINLAPSTHNNFIQVKKILND